MSLVLRHEPAKFGVELDSAGWARVDGLLAAAARAGVPLDDAALRRVVEENDKKRFALSEDGSRIRASQGHSVEVDLGLEPVAPPAVLFHGTATRFLDSIRRQGLVPGTRQHVHLSAEEATATTVGARHGRAAVLRVDAARMHADGHRFFLSANGVWLTDAVPAEYLAFPA
jgi:putative RNA 2'-phosphotransferase